MLLGHMRMQILAEEAAEEDEELIGPPPPELAEELDDAGADERSAEVVRILRCACEPPPCMFCDQSCNSSLCREIRVRCVGGLPRLFQLFCIIKDICCAVKLGRCIYDVEH